MLKQCNMTPKAVEFVAQVKCFDVQAIWALAETLYPGQSPQMVVLWRDKQIEYKRLIAQSEPHSAADSRHFQPFWALMRLSLELKHTLDRFHLDQQQGQEAQLMAQLMAQNVPRLAFPENLAVLQTFKATEWPPPFCPMATWTCWQRPS